MSRGCASTSSTEPAGARLRVGRPVDDAWHAREHDRARAHRARLERDVAHRVQHAQVPRRGWPRAGRALGVRGRVLAQLALVVTRADHLSLVHHHGADRHVVVIERVLGLADRQAHEVLVARKESGCHRERTIAPSLRVTVSCVFGARALFVMSLSALLRRGIAVACATALLLLPPRARDGGLCPLRYVQRLGMATAAANAG